MNPPPDETGFGHVFWLFGLSGAGKSTLATGLARKLRQRGLPALLLDGDALRSGLCRDLSFADVSRTENIRRAAEVAKLAMSQGQVVIAAFITPRERLRTLAREIVGPGHLDLIWVDCPLALCRQRDPKGLYRRSAEGQLRQFTGVDSIFEEPGRSDLRLRTNECPADTLGVELANYCRLRLTPAPREKIPAADFLRIHPGF